VRSLDYLQDQTAIQPNRILTAKTALQHDFLSGKMPVHLTFTSKRDMYATPKMFDGPAATRFQFASD
jgi:hypothetical protein